MNNRVAILAVTSPTGEVGGADRLAEEVEPVGGEEVGHELGALAGPEPSRPNESESAPAEENQTADA